MASLGIRVLYNTRIPREQCDASCATHSSRRRGARLQRVPRVLSSRCEKRDKEKRLREITNMSRVRGTCRLRATRFSVLQLQLLLTRTTHSLSVGAHATRAARASLPHRITRGEERKGDRRSRRTPAVPPLFRSFAHSSPLLFLSSTAQMRTKFTNEMLSMHRVTASGIRFLQ